MIWTILWVLGALIVWRPSTRILIEEFTWDGSYQWSDVLFSAFICAIVCGIAWPLIGAALAIHSLIRHVDRDDDQHSIGYAKKFFGVGKD